MTEENSAIRVRAGVDTGGTFTDFVYIFRGRPRIFKIPSTPADPSRAILAGLERIANETGYPLKEIEVIHGTTVGTNALLERKGARTALVTTSGFEDVIEIGRQARPALYDLDAVKPEPLVPRTLRIGAKERITATGEVLESLLDDDVKSILERLRSANVESIAVCLLFSFVDPRHEQDIERALRELGIPISLSYRILPEYREYERTSTVVINAYLRPVMSSYLTRIGRDVPLLKVMQSSGGSISAQLAAEETVRTVLSGPAGGVVGAVHAARKTGYDNLITFDMGGTSTDVSLCTAEGLRMTNESLVSGFPIAISMMDIHTVGAGGGSIAHVDAAGALRVGPESAGAEPGPACYGRGTLPTVTDANLVLGRFGGTGLLGGEFELDLELAQSVLDSLAKEMSAAAGKRVSPVDAARGVIAVVNINMERALRAISSERGFDPRDFSLMPFGGAGALHAVELARALQIPLVIAPRSAGALSALGALQSDVILHNSRTLMTEVTPSHVDSAAKAFLEMEREAGRVLKKEGFDSTRQRHERFLSLRYKGQSFELEIRFKDGANLERDFHRAHLHRYGYNQKENTIELVAARLRSRGLVEIGRTSEKPGARGSVAPKPHDKAPVHFADKEIMTTIYRRDDLPGGAKLKTPCVITEYSSTTLVPPGAVASVDSQGNVMIRTGA